MSLHSASWLAPRLRLRNGKKEMFSKNITFKSIFYRFIYWLNLRLSWCQKKVDQILSRFLKHGTKWESQIRPISIPISLFHYIKDNTEYYEIPINNHGKIKSIFFFFFWPQIHSTLV